LGRNSGRNQEKTYLEFDQRDKKYVDLSLVLYGPLLLCRWPIARHQKRESMAQGN
jgi:hypothetical protein